VANKNTELFADRLDVEPVSFRGCTQTELMMIGMLSLAWLPIAIVVGLLLGSFILGMGGGFMLAMGTLFLGSNYFRELKAGKPPGYHVQKMKIWAAERRWAAWVVKAKFIFLDGSLDIGRHTKQRRSER